LFDEKTGSRKARGMVPLRQILFQGCGSGSGSGLDPDSRGCLDPEIGRKNLNLYIQISLIF
jgi:hypothetical protein